MHADAVVYRAGKGLGAGVADADPITTEVIRNALNSAANQMKRALIRTSFSPVIYEVLDFAVAIYDRQIRMLAQAPSLPFFMGTMNFCVEAAVEAVGGETALEPGDIVLYNFPYGTGSHPQDAAVVMPVFLRNEELIGVIRASKAVARRRVARSARNCSRRGGSPRCCRGPACRGGGCCGPAGRCRCASASPVIP